MTVYVRTISGKTISIKCDKRQGITRIKDEIERRTKIPKALQHLVNQGTTVSERKTIEGSNIKNETTLEMTLRLQSGMKEDEMMTSAESAEDRKLRRKRSNFEKYNSVTTRSTKKGNKQRLKKIRRKSGKFVKKIRRKMESLLLEFQVNTMEKMEKVMQETNETQSVGVQLQGMNTTVGK